MKKSRLFDYKWNIIVLALIFTAAFLITGITGSAASAAKIEMKESSVSVKLGETVQIGVSYQLPAGTAAQLGVVITDETVAAAVVADNGKGNALLSVAGLQPGSCVIAVYEASDPKVVDYVTVKCGLADKGGVYMLNEGSSFSNVYDDCVVFYNSLMNAKNGDQLAVSKLDVERNSGMDGLVVEGKLWGQNSSSTGLLTFFADFYNASGELIERQPYYLKNTGAGSKVDLIWYIPKGCTKIIVE